MTSPKEQRMRDLRPLDYEALMRAQKRHRDELKKLRDSGVSSPKQEAYHVLTIKCIDELVTDAALTGEPDVIRY